jgi:ATP-dependent HslUV protease ATP-binding subunit HslU
VALEEAEVERRLSAIDLRREAVVLAEENGIVFIDEIDKLISNKSKHSGDASSEGVQRDLLPLIEGTTVEVRSVSLHPFHPPHPIYPLSQQAHPYTHTFTPSHAHAHPAPFFCFYFATARFNRRRFGNVKTDYMLFVASGAFHEHKPSELLAELQGRLPIRVELKALDAKDLEAVLTDTKFNLLEQQVALMRTEGLEVTFAREAIAEIAVLAAEINRSVENIGARRLHTVIEKIMEEVSFSASDMSKCGGEGKVKVHIDLAHVRRKLAPLQERGDLRKFIL